MAILTGELRALMLAALAAAGASTLFAQPLLEYQVKAAYLYNFAKFVEWPDGPADQNGVIILGVLGKNTAAVVERALGSKNLNGRRLIVKWVSTLPEMKTCHILFISSEEKKRQEETIRALADAGVLLVGETEGFIERGGMVNFVREQNRVRFQVNVTAAEKAGLRISSRLLTVAAADGGKH